MSSHYDILYSEKNPDAVRERLVGMVLASREVCVRLDTPVSPFTLWGVIRMTESGDFYVEANDQRSYAQFGLAQVASMGQTAIWITA